MFEFATKLSNVDWGMASMEHIGRRSDVKSEDDSVAAEDGDAPVLTSFKRKGSSDSHFSHLSREGPSSRYDPKILNVDLDDYWSDDSNNSVDIDASYKEKNVTYAGKEKRAALFADLVYVPQESNISNASDDTKEAAAEAGDGKCNNERDATRERRPRWKSAITMGVILVAMSAAIIGMLVVPNTIRNPFSSKNSATSPSALKGAGANLLVGYAALPLEGETPEGDESPSEDETGQMTMQHEFEIAEQVVTACSKGHPDDDMQECHHLCHGKLCCFEKGKYNCANDEGKDCPVYAGCEVLMVNRPALVDWLVIKDGHYVIRDGI